MLRVLIIVRYQLIFCSKIELFLAHIKVKKVFYISHRKRACNSQEKIDEHKGLIHISSVYVLYIFYRTYTLYVRERSCSTRQSYLIKDRGCLLRIGFSIRTLNIYIYNAFSIVEILSWAFHRAFEVHFTSCHMRRTHN